MGMSPVQQGLDAVQVTIGGVDDRLIRDVQLAAVERRG